jgi:L-threonylcarbamoyladenylate synthase
MSESVRSAASLLRSGGLVAFPTETVYGLGADATDAGAVARIFAAKGRPSTNPLIVHVADLETAKRYAAEWNDAAQTLAAVWWPGPLTLVVPKTPEVVDAVSAGRPTVALRVPDHPLALELLREFGGPVAAPSANKSNHVSPTTAAHVREELADAVDLVLDGGPCSVGIESTVVDLTGDRPVILRPGGVPRREIEAIVGRVETFVKVVDPTEPAASPGQHARHYAPRAPAFRFARGRFWEANAALRRMGVGGWKALLSFPGGNLGWGGYPEVPMPATPGDYARELYAALRHVDRILSESAGGAGVILVEMPPDAPEWEAVRDRVIRATRLLET